ncbi:MAG: AI-2E family transporter [Planctomycetales bacterium]|nr:AI-2E family transporter [Planctomycetales bacterium]
MARMISLGVLLALLVVIGILSFEVMATFILPLFLAVMLAVLFHPVYAKLTTKLKGRNRLAAGVTTLLILLAVVLPSLTIGMLAFSEGADVVAKLNRDDLSEKISILRNRLSLGPPPAPVMEALDRIRVSLDRMANLAYVEAEEAAKSAELATLKQKIDADVQTVESGLGFDKLAVAADDKPNPATRLHASWKIWLDDFIAQKPALQDANAWHTTWQSSQHNLERFRTELLGGPLVAPIKQFVRLDNEQLDGLVTRIRSAAGPLALDTTQYVGGLLWEIIVGLVVVLLGVYYFLADGPAMLKALMELSPLDPKHTERLLVDFGNLTRAVVLSMVLAALAQGLLAGAGYLFVGVNSVFLLTLLTILFAMVPLVGATIVWGGICAWIYFYEQRTGTAIGLAIYCAIVVSLADNIIKPLVLQERSNLHPLPALLSVLGGAQALGPIGVFVGPMVLALLHTLLVMLHGEMKNMETKRA